MRALQPGDPGTVGPFRVDGRLADHQAGVVLLGHDSAGRAAAIAMLHAAAAGDPAARDRLAGRAEELTRTAPDQLPAHGPDPLPWVATAYPGTAAATAQSGGRPGIALALLDAAALAGGGPSPAGLGDDRPAGPDFAPHWQGSPAAGALSPPPAPGSPPFGSPPFGSPTSPPGPTKPAASSSRRSLLVLAGCVAGVVVLLAGAWWLVSSPAGPGEDLQAGPTDSGLPTSDPVPTPGPSEEPAPSRTPSPTPTWDGEDGPPGPVAGPTYGDGEPTYLMDLSGKGFPFDFRAPGSWGCIRGSVEGRPKVVAWVCMDESGIWGGEEPEVRARAEIWVEPCPKPCGAAAWRELRSRTLDYPNAVTATDATTMYGEKIVESGSRVQLTMSHVFAEKNGRPTRHLGVEVTGAPEDVTTMQKLINELRLRSG